MSFADTATPDLRIVLQDHMHYPPFSRIQGGNALGLAVVLDLLGQLSGPLFKVFAPAVPVISSIKGEHDLAFDIAADNLAKQVLQAIKGLPFGAHDVIYIVTGYMTMNFVIRLSDIDIRGISHALEYSRQVIPDIVELFRGQSHAGLVPIHPAPLIAFEIFPLAAVKFPGRIDFFIFPAAFQADGNGGLFLAKTENT